MVFQQVPNGLQLDVKLHSLSYSLCCNMDAWPQQSLSFGKQGHTVISVSCQPPNDDYVKLIVMGE